MASNLKSIRIIRTNDYNHMYESVSPAQFHLLYQAIAEVDTYWKGRVQQEKEEYCRKYNINKVIDIQGKIAVTFAYSTDVKFICTIVNGSSDRINGPDVPLCITVTAYYVEFRDDVMREITEYIFNANKRNGVINVELGADISESLGISTTDIQNYNHIIQNYVPNDDDSIDVFLGVFRKELNGRMTYTEQGLANQMDFFLMPTTGDHAIQNQLRYIRKMDWTPFCMLFSRLMGKTSSLSNAVRAPRLITSDINYAMDSRKDLEEWWFYLPCSSSAGNRSLHLPALLCEDTTKAEFWQAGQIMGPNSTAVSTIQRGFIKCNSMTGDHGGPYTGKRPALKFTELCLDVKGNMHALTFGYYLWINTAIILNSYKKEYTDTALIEQVKHMQFDEAKIFFENAVENGIFTSCNGTNSTKDLLKYVVCTDGNWGWGSVVDINTQGSSIYVPDDRYWFYIFGPLVQAKLREKGLPCSYCVYGHYNGQAGDAWVDTALNIYHTITDYKNTRQDGVSYDAVTDTCWWQQNNILNTFMRAYFNSDDNALGFYPT